MGVEIGQVLAAVADPGGHDPVAAHGRLFDRTAAGANVLLMLAGFVLAGEQLAGYIFGGAVS